MHLYHSGAWRKCCHFAGSLFNCWYCWDASLWKVI